MNFSFAVVIAFKYAVDWGYKTLVGYTNTFSSEGNWLVGVSDNKYVEGITKLLIVIFYLSLIWCILVSFSFGFMRPVGTESILGFELNAETVIFINRVILVNVFTYGIFWFRSLIRINYKDDTDMVCKVYCEKTFKKK